MNTAKPVNIGYSGGTAYRGGDGKAVTAQEYWHEQFARYFGQPTPKAA